MAVFLLLSHQLNLVILIPAAALVYFIALILLRAIDRQEFAMLKKIVRDEAQ
jgi:energy-converting hydrogenase Eha subunit E